MAGYAS
jgi:hydroxypyruvate isomerase